MSTQTIPRPEVAAPTLISAVPTLIEEGTLFRVLTAISFCHLLNDMVQSLVPSMYPILKANFHLDFTRIGLITLTYQIIASLLQPVIGYFTDRRPMPYSAYWDGLHVSGPFAAGRRADV